MVTSKSGKAVVVRLLGIDTPDSFGEDAPHLRWALAARKALKELVEGRTVRVQYAAEKPRDRFGRLLGSLFLADGTNVNAALISRGMALHYRRYMHPRFDRFDALQTEARLARRGIHGPLADAPGLPSPRSSLPPPPAAAHPASRAAAPPTPSRKREEEAPVKDAPPFFVTVTGKIHRGTCTARFVVRDLKAGKVQAYQSFEDAQEGRSLGGGPVRWRGTSSCRVCRPYLQ